MMKRIIAIITVAALLMTTAACSAAGSSTAPSQQSGQEESSRTVLYNNDISISSYDTSESTYYSDESSYSSYESSYYSGESSYSSYESSYYSDQSSYSSYESSYYSDESSYKTEESSQESITFPKDKTVKVEDYPIKLLGQSGKFTGKMKNGLPVNGTFESNNIVYSGAWKDDIRFGKGETLIQSGNGLIMESGNYINDYLQGIGYSIVMQNIKGEYTIREYYSGRFFQGKRDGEKAVLICSADERQDGAYYVLEGTFKNNKPSGTLKYTLFDENGKDIECGKYTNGEYKKSNALVRFGHLVKNAALNTITYLLSDDVKNDLIDFALKKTDQYIQKKVLNTLSSIGKKILNKLTKTDSE